MLCITNREQICIGQHILIECCIEGYSEVLKDDVIFFAMFEPEKDVLYTYSDSMLYEDIQNVEEYVYEHIIELDRVCADGEQEELRKRLQAMYDDAVSKIQDNSDCIEGKPLCGYRYADGVHWWWGEKEVAIVNELNKEIEWCDRINNFPDAVVETIRERVPKTTATWAIEVRRNRISETQGYINVFVNGKNMGISFEDKIELVNGEWKSVVSDEELGKYVYACLWNPYDTIYHYSDRFKDVFKPGWKNEGKCLQSGVVCTYARKVDEDQYFCKGQRLAFDLPWCIYCVENDLFTPYFRVYVGEQLMAFRYSLEQCYEFLKNLTVAEAHIAERKNGGK